MGRWTSTPPSLRHRNRLSPSPQILDLLSAAFSSLCHQTASASNSEFTSSTNTPDLAAHGRQIADFARAAPGARRLLLRVRSIADVSCHRDRSQSFAGFAMSGQGLIIRSGAASCGFSSTAVQEVEATCWSCEEKSSETPFFRCPSCAAIQPLDRDLDFFQLLSLDRSFELDLKLVEQQYKNLQKFLHPDLSSLKSEREQGYSADQSAQVIKAYYTLLGPLSRAQYLLKLNGIDIDEEGTIHDPALLMEIMELREEVEDVNDPKKLEEIKESSKKKMQECEAALKAVFHGGDLASAVPIVQRMTYYHKIIKEITRKQ